MRIYTYQIQYRPSKCIIIQNLMIKRNLFQSNTTPDEKMGICLHSLIALTSSEK